MKALVNAHKQNYQQTFSPRQQTHHGLEDDTTNTTWSTKEAHAPHTNHNIKNNNTWFWMVHTSKLVSMLMFKNPKEDEMDGKDTTFMRKTTLIPLQKNALWWHHPWQRHLQGTKVKA